ncbi:4Fe-4S binding protein [bacterium]|nr:4Fe-4S binding protein [bacterium]
MQKYRILSFIIVHLLIFFHVIWAENSFLGSFDFQEFFDRFLGEGILNAGSLMVIFAFFFTLLFGRFFCGWLCHFGAIQEFAWWIFDKLGIKPKTINSRLLFFLPLFILFNFYIMPNTAHFFNADSQWNLSLNLAYPEVWTFLPGLIIGTLTFIVDGFLIVYFLGRKGFCRFVCPWGAFLKLPTSLSMFKVRKTGECTHCNMCTSGCPIAIDVSYEINKFDKVLNSNCTSCMICIDDCPENALSYRFSNPASDFENTKLSDFKFHSDSFSHYKIKDIFFSLRSKDFIIIPFCILFGLSLDGLYSMGHMLSFGIAAIISLMIFNFNLSFNKRIILFVIAFSFSIFNFGLKYSQSKALEYYEDKKFELAIPYFENIVYYYPLEVGKYHAYLAACYFRVDNIEKSYFHYDKAKAIIPDNPHLHDLELMLFNNKEYD